MGKTYRRDSRFAQKKQGKSFSKDQQNWKKNKHNNNNPEEKDNKNQYMEIYPEANDLYNE